MIYYVMKSGRKSTVVSMFHYLDEARKAAQVNDRYFVQYGKGAVNSENGKRRIS